VEKHPNEYPDTWVCSMNEDAEYASCSSEQENILIPKGLLKSKLKKQQAEANNNETKEDLSSSDAEEKQLMTLSSPMERKNKRHTEKYWNLAQIMEESVSRPKRTIRPPDRYREETYNGSDEDEEEDDDNNEENSNSDEDHRYHIDHNNDNNDNDDDDNNNSKNNNNNNEKEERNSKRYRGMPPSKPSDEVVSIGIQCNLGGENIGCNEQCIYRVRELHEKCYRLQKANQEAERELHYLRKHLPQFQRTQWLRMKTSEGFGKDSHLSLASDLSNSDEESSLRRPQNYLEKSTDLTNPHVLSRNDSDLYSYGHRENGFERSQVSIGGLKAERLAFLPKKMIVVGVEDNFPKESVQPNEIKEKEEDLVEFV